MKPKSGWATYVAVSLVGLAVLSVALVSAQDDEKPNAGVARVSSIRGEVHRIRGESGGQVEAKINMPLLRGDTVAARVDSQAEIQVDPSNMIRLAPGSEIQIAELTSTQIRLRVARGLVTYIVLETNERQIELLTPNMTVHPVKDGVYHVQVLSPSETLLIVRKGEADVSTPEGTTSVDEGKTINVRGVDNPEYLIAAAFDPDDWSRWKNKRDKAGQNTSKTQHADREHKYELYSNKTSYLATAPAYGSWCLSPLVNAGWLPYLPDDSSERSSQNWYERSTQTTSGSRSTW